MTNPGERVTALDIDIDKLTLEELRSLKVQVDRAIGSFESRRRKEALAAAERAARELGFNLAELTGRGGKSRRAAPAATGENPPKYAHPDDATQTWSGRGRRPRWVTEQLDAGRSLEDLLI